MRKNGEIFHKVGYVALSIGLYRLLGMSAPKKSVNDSSIHSFRDGKVAHETQDFADRSSHQSGGLSGSGEWSEPENWVRRQDDRFHIYAS